MPPEIPRTPDLAPDDPHAGGGAAPNGPPRALFVIPCFNHGAHVADAVASALAQEATDVRVVVVNDGSDDNSTPAACDALADDRVRVVHQANAGLPAARNAGIDACAADDHDHFVWLDADDTVAPMFVRELHAAIGRAGDDRVSHAYCYERILAPGAEDTVWRTPEWNPDLLLLTNLHPVTALVRRSAMDDVGPFDTHFREGYEDWELWVRMALAGHRGVRVEQPLFDWRRHGGESLIDAAVKKHDELFARLFDKHRAAYIERAERLFKLWNHVARAGDVNWLDHSLRPMSVLGLSQHITALEGWLTQAQHAHAAATDRLGAERDAHAQTKARIAQLEAELERMRSLRGAAGTMAQRLRARLGMR